MRVGSSRSLTGCLVRGAALAGGERLGQAGTVAAADREDDDRGKGLAEAEPGADGGGVEAAHLVHRKPVGLRLGHERGDGLAGIVQRPRLRAAVIVGGARGD